MGGGGGFLGLGGSMSTPDYPESEPVPVREAEVDPVSKAVREAEQRKIRARRGMSGTILTSPLGTTGSSSYKGSGGLLGHSG